MFTYLISYDLTKPDQDYEDLWTLLKKWGAKRVLKSAWALKTDRSAKDIREALTGDKGPLDANDRLVIVKADEWANHNPITKMQDL
jgi:hypothetical protein